jgi:hypothetical protein
MILYILILSDLLLNIYTLIEKPFKWQKSDLKQ